MPCPKRPWFHAVVCLLAPCLVAAPAMAQAEGAGVAAPAQPAPRPVVPQPQPAKPAVATAPGGKPCPKCGKAGTPVPGTGHHLCRSCDLKY